MSNTWALCALWVGLELAATLLAIRFKISTALSEIVVGTVAQLVIGVFLTGIFGFAQIVDRLILRVSSCQQAGACAHREIRSKPAPAKMRKP
jgi:hypothetical protein